MKRNFKQHLATIKPLVFSILFMIALSLGAQNQQEYTEYRGTVRDSQDNDPLVFATLSVNGTNISTITNTEGKFSLKVPNALNNTTISISFLGYQTRQMPISAFSREDTDIRLEVSVTELEEVDINFPKSAEALVKSAFRKKVENNLNNQALMTAFYRETIKKRRKNASLTEAVVNIYKQPYSSLQKDDVKLYKSRKSTDYTRLDTIALKLMGGPFNNLYGDLMKYPEYIFDDETFDSYQFTFDPSTRINNQAVYVVNFKGIPEVDEPTYFGKLYIDSKNMALTRAEYRLNVENKKLASEFFVRKKPGDTDVYPTLATYRVDYREKDGKWYYGYSSIQLEFKVSKRKKIFNSVYSLTSEMAVTDWEEMGDEIRLAPKERLKPTVVISDEASGFSDPDFWGAYNVIEPEKSIESAIEKIKKQLVRAKKGEGSGR